MERLTIPDVKIDGGTRRTVIDPRKVKEHAMTIYWALKKYEDTSLTPEQIMNQKERNEWIPVKKEWPPFGKKLQATILHHEWISDYYSSWVPEEEKVYHASYTEVCEIYPVGVMWCYACAEDDYNSDIAYIEPAKNISEPVAEIVAWRPLPDPYNPKEDN